LLRADLVDSKGDMAITLNLPHNLIVVVEAKLVVGQGICIKDFKISAKTIYDHGDCTCILVLHDRSIVETIPSICKEYKFVPTTTIKQLTNTTTPFVTSTVVSLVTYAKQIGPEYALDIKDGQSEEDKATVCTNSIIHTFLHLLKQILKQLPLTLVHFAIQVYLFTTFLSFFNPIQKQILKQEMPMVLF